MLPQKKINQENVLFTIACIVVFAAMIALYCLIWLL